MSNSSTNKTSRLAGMSIFVALVIVLQALSPYLKLGPFSITLALTPIVVGSALYGAKAGAWLGAVFGGVVLVMCITGVDAGGQFLWNLKPLTTAVLCIFKGAAAGLAAGLMYKAISRKNSTVAVFVAAIISPVINTGIFCVGLAVFFYDTLVAWAGGGDVIYFIFFGLIGVNFLAEVTVNAVLSPVAVRIIEGRRKGVM